MNIEEIIEAARNGRTFRFTGKINELSFINGKLNIDWVFPDAGKPFSPSVDFSYIELAPKYDPCRRFRKGDIVRLREYNGRKPYDYWHKQVIKNFGAKLDTVLEDELDSGNVDIFQDAPIDELTVRVNSCHLELVTPIEELEPYCVRKYSSFYAVEKYNNHTERPATYDIDFHPYAKAAAEAECDRLNEEYRKEQSNG